MGHSHDSDPVAWRWRLRSVGRWHLIDEPANQATADHPSFEQEALYSGVGAHLPGEPDAHAVYTMLTAKAKARTSTDNVSDVLDSVRACRLGATVAPSPAPYHDIVWLWTHCRAIGMTKKSDSGSLRDDIALFTVDLQSEVRAASGASPEPTAEALEKENETLRLHIQRLTKQRDALADIADPIEPPSDHQVEAPIQLPDVGGTV